MLLLISRHISSSISEYLAQFLVLVRLWEYLDSTRQFLVVFFGNLGHLGTQNISKWEYSVALVLWSGPSPLVQHFNNTLCAAICLAKPIPSARTADLFKNKASLAKKTAMLLMIPKDQCFKSAQSGHQTFSVHKDIDKCYIDSSHLSTRLRSLPIFRHQCRIKSCK